MTTIVPTRPDFQRALEDLLQRAKAHEISNLDALFWLKNEQVFAELMELLKQSVDMEQVLSMVTHPTLSNDDVELVGDICTTVVRCGFEWNEAQVLIRKIINDRVMAADQKFRNNLCQQVSLCYSV